MYAQFPEEYQPTGLSELPSGAQDIHQPHSTDLIGRPILFASGQFAGQAVRAELREIQQADLGRKCVFGCSDLNDALADNVYHTGTLGWTGDPLTPLL